MISFKKDGRVDINRLGDDSDNSVSMSLGSAVTTLSLEEGGMDENREQVHIHTHPVPVGWEAVRDLGQRRLLPEVSGERVDGVVDGKLRNAMPPSSEDIIQAYYHRDGQGRPQRRQLVVDSDGIWWFDANSANSYLEKAVEENSLTVSAKRVLAESIIDLVDPEMAEEIKGDGDKQLSKDTIRRRIESFSEKYRELFSRCNLFENVQEEDCRRFQRIGSEYMGQIEESYQSGKTAVYQGFTNEYTFRQMRLFSPVDTKEELLQATKEFSEYSWKTWGIKNHYFPWDALPKLDD
jgi:hypothetical protein